MINTCIDDIRHALKRLLTEIDQKPIDNAILDAINYEQLLKDLEAFEKQLMALLQGRLDKAATVEQNATDQVAKKVVIGFTDKPSGSYDLYSNH